MNRITKHNLEAVVARINRVMGTPERPYLNGEPQALCYHLDGAYSGYALHQMCKTGSGIHDVFGGHMPMRELYNRMHAFLIGVAAVDRDKS